jgi:hypothetical protein
VQSTPDQHQWAWKARKDSWLANKVVGLSVREGFEVDGSIGNRGPDRDVAFRRALLSEHGVVATFAEAEAILVKLADVSVFPGGLENKGQ